ncbi:MAG: hypothetical protein GY941_21465 [Planctomycetes bacterium]|nr:hypothetical protein [Planctomycetota bacterium]
MYEVKCRIDGIVPMMQDRYAMPIESEKPVKKAKTNWKIDLPKKAYIDKVGMYVPSDSIRMMMIGNKLRTGAAQILGSQIETKKGSAYRNFCKACVWVIGDKKDPTKVYITPKRKTFDDYDERTFINASGGRSITRRPLAKLPWSLEFVVQVTLDTFDQSKIKEMFEVAGLMCGCGAYGPTFGRFRIAKWNVIS